MKLRYSFLTYIINMTCASTAFMVVAIIIFVFLLSPLRVDTSGDSMAFIVGFSIFLAILGLISGLFSSLIVSLIAFISFRPQSISKRRFQIVSYAIVFFISSSILLFIHGLFFSYSHVHTTEIILAITIIMTMMLANYFAVPNLVKPIEKRKSKNSQ